MSLPCFCLRGWTWRRLHRTIATIAAFPLVLTIITGFSYRFARNVLLYDKDTVEWLLRVHTLECLSLDTVYPIVVGLSTITLTLSGLPLSYLKTLYRQFLVRSTVRTVSSHRKSVYNSQLFHRWAGLFLAPPMLATAASGMVWTMLYGRWSKEDTKWLMRIHQGAYLGDPAIYTTLVFALSLPSLLTGAILLFPSVRAAFPAMKSNGVSDEDRVKYAMLNVQRAFEADSDTDANDSESAGTERRSVSGAPNTDNDSEADGS